MKKYILRRLLFFIPTLIIISILAFLISVNAPGDPVERMVASPGGDGGLVSDPVQRQQKEYWLKKLGLDLPLFYFSVHALSDPGSGTFLTQDKATVLARLSRESGDPEATRRYFQTLHYLLEITSTSEKELKDGIMKSQLFSELLMLKHAASFSDIEFRLQRLEPLISSMGNSNTEITRAFSATHTAYREMATHTTCWKNFIPVLSLHRDNQYHRWIFGDGNWLTGSGAVMSRGVIRGDFGISYQTRQPVSRVIGSKIGWSLFFTLFSIFLAYLVSVPVGVLAGSGWSRIFDKGSALILFLIYSMPAFWVATLLLMIFANPDHLWWFPASGVKPPAGYPEGSDFLMKIKYSAPYIILPLICYTYSSVAFISRAVRISMADTMTMDFIRTAKAKGLPFRLVVFRHAFRNSLLPLITVFANVFPMAIGGSVILETIFSIPGMGLEIFQSVHNQNYPMIVAVFTITGILTLAGYLVSDLLYTVADPRITFWNKRS